MKPTRRIRQALLTAAVLSTLSTAFAGTTCTDGVMRARPLKDGRAPVIDGSFDDWDLSGVVRCWNAEAYAEQQNCSLALMYDDDALYLAVEMAFAGRDAQNPNRPQDRYWYGDCIQFRLCTDPKLGYPLPMVSRRDPNSPFVKNPAVNCVNVWRDTKNGTDNLYFTPGALFDCEKSHNPAGTAVKIVTEPGGLRAEAKITWAALGVASGKNPFKVGEKMPAVFDVKWSPGKDGHYTAAVYCKDPGAFAFLNQNTWGQVAFTAADEKVEPPPSYADVARRATAAGGPRDGARIAFTLPKKAKVSVNILDEKGGVIRELAGGEPRDAGEVAFHWDGRDARGFACETGKSYRWAAYAHDGLDAEYFGTVGTSGTPPYDTPDGKGGWGGDHGPVVAAAADDTGRYFVWNMSESGKAIVKTDFAGKVIWRATPFVGGGYGPFTAAVSKDGVLALVLQAGKKSGLVRVDAATGNYLLYPDNTGLADLGLATNDVPFAANCAVRDEYLFNCAGLAAIGDEYFAGDYAGGCIRVVEAATGKARRTIPCAGVRGLAATKDGALLAACQRPARVVKIDPKTGAAETALDEADGLVAPYGVAIDAAGAIYVSDLGASQQVKKFAGRRLVYAVGKRGGRGPVGRIDFDALRYPFGVAVDRSGALLVTEAAPPKIVRVLDAATGRETRRYFGYTAYSPTNVPDCDDPLLQYYSLSGPDSFARARVPATGGIGDPDACWDFNAAGYGTGCAFSTMLTPQVVRFANGEKYLVPDSEIYNRKTKKATMIVCKIDGDAVTPCAGVLYEKEKKAQKYRLWSDENGDGLVQDGECSPWRECRVDGRAFSLGGCNGAVQMDAAGNLFLAAGKENLMVGIPADGFTACGAPRWKADAAYVAIPEILPGAKMLFSTWRAGPLGTRRDAAGNFYTMVNGAPKYATPEYEKYLHQGMGHTADMLGVYVVKHDAKGELVWCVGRKAVGMLKPGEILHHWCIAGMVGDGYVVAASEWGVFTVYTTDGFYVDRLFDAPGLPGRGIPYSFGGEDFSGQIAYFPKRDEVWAYNAGHTFRVKGFEKGRVKGEWRTSGTVALDKVLPLVFPGAKARALTDVKLARKDGKVVYTAHVADATPLVNVARGAADVFKGGDAVGFQMGPATAPKELPERKPSGRKTGFARILAARVGGADRVFAFKPFVGTGEKRPVEYATPAGGTSAFEFVGEVADAKVAFTPDADGKGYAVRIEVPEAFFELDFAKDVFFDAEALFSGDGGRGLQTVRREWLHTPDSSEATMVDDVPTEARLRPKGWQRVAW